jgi:hypothetical protein
VGIGTSIVVIAIGAILDFAVKVNNAHFNVNTIGLILMIVGAVGLLASLMFWNSWGGFGSSYQRRRVYRTGPGGTVVNPGGSVVNPGGTVVSPGSTVVEEHHEVI